MRHTHYPYVIQRDEEINLSTGIHAPIIHTYNPDMSSQSHWLLNEAERQSVLAIQQELISRKITNIKLHKNQMIPSHLNLINNPSLPYSVIFNENRIFALYRGKHSLLGYTQKTKVKLVQDMNKGKWYALKVINFLNSHKIDEVSPNRIMTTIDEEVNNLDLMKQYQGHIHQLNNSVSTSIPKKYLFMTLHGAYGGHNLFHFLNHPHLGSHAVNFKGTISFKTKVNMVFKTMIELKKLHNQSTLVRDLKSANIIWDPLTEEIHFIDFAAFVTFNRIQKAGFFLVDKQNYSTPDYCAPEVHKGKDFIQRLVPYFYKKLGYLLGQEMLDLMRSKDELTAKTNPYHPQSYNQMRDNPHYTHYEDEEKARYIRETASFTIYEAFFYSIYKHICSIKGLHKQPFWKSKLDDAVIYERNIQFAHHLTQALIDSCWAISFHKIQDNPRAELYPQMNHVVEAFTYIYKESNFQDVYGSLIRFLRVYYKGPPSDLGKFNLTIDFFTYLNSIKKKIIFPDYSNYFIYSYASDTYAMGILISEIFKNHSINLPVLEAVQVKQIFDIREMASKMTNPDPFSRMRLDEALSLMGPIYDAVMTSEMELDIHFKKQLRLLEREFNQLFVESLEAHPPTESKLYNSPRSGMHLQSNKDKSSKPYHSAFFNELKSIVHALASNSKTLIPTPVLIEASLNVYKLYSSYINQNFPNHKEPLSHGTASKLIQWIGRYCKLLEEQLKRRDKAVPDVLDQVHTHLFSEQRDLCSQAIHSPICAPKIEHTSPTLSSPTFSSPTL